MCDYSLHEVATRPAEVAETLVLDQLLYWDSRLCEPGRSESRDLPSSWDRDSIRE